MNKLITLQAVIEPQNSRPIHYDVDTISKCFLPTKREMSLLDELFDYVPTMEEASETLEYEGSENSTVPEVQQLQDSAQYSPIVQTPTYGNAVASNYKVTSPCLETPTLHASIESRPSSYILHCSWGQRQQVLSLSQVCMHAYNL